MNTQPRGLRNNNPLNIKHSASRWQGARLEQTDQTFVQFTSMAMGYRAAWRILESYWQHFHKKQMPFTPRNIIHRWAPPTENDTKAYIRTVLTLTSIGGKENLLPPSNASGYYKLSRLLAAMTVMENGIRMSQVDTEAIFQGYKLAFPENAQELDEWMLAEDEYTEW